MPHQFTVAKSPWGPQDEIGALNHITSESRASILARTDRSRVFDLSCDYFVGMPTWSSLGDPPYQIYKTHDPTGDVVTNPLGLDDEANRLTSYTGDAIAMYTHSGTHIDALNHFGWDKCGIDTIPPVIARGVLLDIAALTGVDQLPPSYAIGPEELAAAGVHEFALIGLPLKLRGASASPIRCIAMPLSGAR